MSLVKTNKNRSFPSFFDDFFEKDWPAWASGEENYMPACNVKETEKEFTLEVSLPGYDKTEIKVEHENGVLKIYGEKKAESSEEKDNYTRKEFSYGSFSRSWTLPDNVKEEDIVANYKDGILNVNLPKRETTTQKLTKQVNVN